MDSHQLVHPEKKPLVDGEKQLHSPEQPAAVTKVFDDDNLLREIIVRVGFPTTLVRAALVCKRWLVHASDRKFLSRFRELHPPRLLGYYFTEMPGFPQGPDAPRFVPMLPQPPELAAVIRLLESYNFGAHKIMQCRNGSILTKAREGTKWTHGVHRPLCPGRSMDIIPPFPKVHDHNIPKFSAIVSKAEGSGLSYLYLSGELPAWGPGQSTMCVHMLQDGVWRMHNSPTYLRGLHFGPGAMIVDNKIYYRAATIDVITVFDLMASSFSTIQLPPAEKHHYVQSTLSRADDASSVYLIDPKGFQLRVWLHKGDNWLLVDIICLHEMLAMLGMSYHNIGDEDVPKAQIIQVGDNAQFVLLLMGQSVFYLDIKCRTPCKVYQNTSNDRCLGSIHPFMMIWPPTFPVLEDDPARNVM